MAKYSVGTIVPAVDEEPSSVFTAGLRMQKFEGAAIPMFPSHDGLKYAVGNPHDFSGRPLRIFAPEVRSFVSRLSEQLMADQDARKWADVVSFAWWCRKANIERLASVYDDGILRLGRGVAFHITPNNIPVNFAFSWIFSLLAGNANLVRLPDFAFPQLVIILRHVKNLLAEKPYRELAAMNIFLTYGREEQITLDLSAMADVRIIWGGDATIRTIRTSPLPPRAIDIGFSDRYSFSILGAGRVLALGKSDFPRLIAGFFNDTYLMDQNACSSPRLVIWHGGSGEAVEAQERFWNALGQEVVSRYELAPISAVDKFTQVCRDAIELEFLNGFHHFDNRIFRLQLRAVFPGIEKRRGNCGYFYEYITDNLDDLAPIINNKYQTLTYFGVSKELFTSFILRNRITGIDRIVPVGSAMDIGLIWDGYDLIRSFSRVCNVC